MKLTLFKISQGEQIAAPFVKQPTETFTKGFDDVVEMDCNEAGTRILVRRGKLPDLVITPFGWGELDSDPGPIPGGRNPKEEERKAKR